jgi:hypothetical protein
VGLVVAYWPGRAAVLTDTTMRSLAEDLDDPPYAGAGDELVTPRPGYRR